MATNGYRMSNGTSRDVDDRYYFFKMKEILEAFPNKGPSYAPAKLMDYLYIGSLRNADDHSLMKRLGITHVLNMCGNRRVDMHRNPYPRDTGVRHYLAFPAEDQESYNISQHFTECIAFIYDAKKSGGIAFVHCNLGVNRSGAVVAAFMLHDTDKRLLEVVSYLKMKRGFVLCNKSFRKQLIQFAREIGKLDHVGPYELERYREERRRARQLCGKPPLPEDEPPKSSRESNQGKTRKSDKSPLVSRSSKNQNNNPNQVQDGDEPDLSTFAFFRGKKGKFDSISLPEKRSKWLWKSSDKLDKNGLTVSASRIRPLCMTVHGNKRSVSTSDLSLVDKTQDIKNVNTLDTLYEDMEELALNGGSQYASNGPIRNSLAYASMPRRLATTHRNPAGHVRQSSAPAMYIDSFPSTGKTRQSSAPMYNNTFPTTGHGRQSSVPALYADSFPPTGHGRQSSVPALYADSFPNTSHVRHSAAPAIYADSSRPRAATYESNSLNRPRSERAPRVYRGAKSDTAIPPSPATTKKSFFATLFRRKPPTIKDDDKWKKKTAEY